jgi:hypothetical protein
MVLISIHPFAVRKIVLLAVALLGVSSALCFADSLFMARRYAPSQDRSRPAQLVAQPQHSIGSSSANVPSAANLKMKNGGDTRPLVPGDMELVRAGFQVDQYLATRIFAPFSEMAVCGPSNAGLALALSGADTAEASGF